MILISPEQEALISSVFESYLTEHHHEDILQLTSDADEETHQPVVVNAMTLFEANMEVGDYFNAYPNEVLAIFDKVLQRTALELLEKGSATQCGGQRPREHKIRKTPHARITGLPMCPELTRDTIPRSRDVGHFLSVTGTVIRTSVTKVLEYKREYMCAKCRHVFTLEADFDQFYIFSQPVTCPNPEGCSSYKFSCLSEESEPAACRDYQEIKIQEQVQRLSVGSIPRSMVVVLEDDLVDSCKSGDDVTVYGVMHQRWKPLSESTPCNVELVLKANNIEVNNQQAAAALIMKDVMEEFENFWNGYAHDPLAGRNQILLSLCPQVFGMYVVKLAVAMVLAGGVQRKDSSGSKIRGECHLLLVGDPGTGKSQFLKYAAKIMPRSVLTAGIGSTSAGLTVAAVRDGGDWHLEAGALVLADGGLCCIDEFNNIKEHDRMSIHEAMEQQSISVAKAGMVCKLNTRTTILAAANPKGQYDSNEPLSVNVALASPLLSRFDLVLVLLDTKNAEWDRIISSFILEDRALPAESQCLWSMEKMKAYFSVIRRLQPEVSEEANSILARYYQLQRQSNSRNAARTTIRMLESLSRLAEGHARLMYRETVTIEDAVMAVSVMECSMQGGALLGNVNTLLTSFPADATQQYETQCRVLLEGLKLPLLLDKEMKRLARLKNTSEASPPPDNTLNKTPRHDINSKGDVALDGGLDWFHSISSSSSPNVMTSPIITSTQENIKRKQNTSWSDISMITKQPNNLTSNPCSTVNHDVISNASATFTSDSGEQNKDKSSKTQTEIMQSERQSVNPSQSPECVFQKVSKNVRHRRLRELELKDQQCDQRKHGDKGLLKNTANKTVSNKSGAATESSISSSLSSGNASRHEKEDNRDRTGTENTTDKLSSEELHAKLSSFTFRPKKMRPSAHIPNLDGILHDRDEFQTEENPSKRNLHTCTERMSNQTAVNHDAADTARNRGKERLSLGGSRRNQVSSVGEVEGTTSDISVCSKELRNDASSREKGQGQTSCRLKEKTDQLCQQQTTKVNELKSTTCTPKPSKPSIDVGDQAPSKPEHPKSTVASSTLAKLSRFSFNCATELEPTASPKGEKSPPGVVGSRLALGVGTEDRRTQNNPEHSLSGHKMKTVNIIGTAKEILQPPATDTAPPTHPANPSTSVDQNAVNLKKRRCFELGPPRSSAGCYTGHSLFSSAELSNDVFDTDWDQVVSKKTKI